MSSNEIKNLIATLHDNPSPLEIEPESHSLKEAIPWLFKHSDEEITVFLTYLEYKQVLIYLCPEEFNSSGFTKSDSPSCPNIKKSSAFWNFMFSLVRSSILSRDDEAERKDIFDRWISIAYKLQKMKNFSGVTYIINALESTVISKLSLGGKLKSSNTELYKKLETLNLDFGVSRFPSIFKMMKQCDGLFIPAIIVITQRLAALLESKNDNYDFGLYDFKTREQIGEIIQIIVKAQRITYDFSDINNEEFITFAKTILGTKLLTEDEKWETCRTPITSPRREKSNKSFSKKRILPRLTLDKDEGQHSPPSSPRPVISVEPAEENTPTSPGRKHLRTRLHDEILGTPTRNSQVRTRDSYVSKTEEKKVKNKRKSLTGRISKLLEISDDDNRPMSARSNPHVSFNLPEEPPLSPRRYRRTPVNVPQVELHESTSEIILHIPSDMGKQNISILTKK